MPYNDILSLKGIEMLVLVTGIVVVCLVSMILAGVSANRAYEREELHSRLLKM
jgi:hypothetical protein